MGVIVVLAGKHHGRGDGGMEGDEGVTACLPAGRPRLVVWL